MTNPAAVNATDRGPTTFPAVLASLLRADATRPLVTFYDDATGERVELSVATYANWVAKTASLAQDELDLGRGALALVDLPTHWLGTVWPGAAWSLGAAVTDDPSLVGEADLVVCGPDRVDGYAATAAVPVVAASLLPLGGRFTDPLPSGVTDYGAVVLGQPDGFTPLDPPTADDVAWRDADGATTQRDLLHAAPGGPAGPEGRLLTDLNPCSRPGLATLVHALRHGDGAVWVRRPDPDRWRQRVDQERITAELRA